MTTPTEEILLAELERKIKALVKAGNLAIEAMKNMRGGTFRHATAELRKALGELPND